MNTHSPQPESTPPSKPVRLTLIAQVVVLLVVILLVAGLLPRWIAHRKLLAENRTESAITVDVTNPTASKPDLGHAAAR